jgi:hypothetical protein
VCPTFLRYDDLALDTGSVLIIIEKGHFKGGREESISAVASKEKEEIDPKKEKEQEGKETCETMKLKIMVIMMVKLNVGSNIGPETCKNEHTSHPSFEKFSRRKHVPYITVTLVPVVWAVPKF